MTVHVLPLFRYGIGYRTTSMLAGLSARFGPMPFNGRAVVGSLSSPSAPDDEPIRSRSAVVSVVSGLPADREIVVDLLDRANSTAAQLGRGVVTVVPVTSNTDRTFAFQALLPATVTGLRQDSKAQAEQVRSIAVERLGSVLGRAPADVMLQLDDALRLHLPL